MTSRTGCIAAVLGVALLACPAVAQDEGQDDVDLPLLTIGELMRPYFLPPDQARRQWALWEMRENTSRFRKAWDLKLNVVGVPRSEVVIDADPDLPENMRRQFLSGARVNVPLHPYNSHKVVPFMDRERVATWRVSPTASRSVLHESPFFTIKLPTNNPHSDPRFVPREYQQRETSKADLSLSVVVSRDRARHIKAVDGLMGPDASLGVMLDVLSIRAREGGNGFVVRDLSTMKANHYYLPGFSIPYVGREIAAANGEEFATFWQRHDSELYGRLKAQMLLRYGLVFPTPNAQNRLIELDAALKPTGRMLLRDLSDSQFHEQVSEAIGAREARLADARKSVRHIDPMTEAATFYQMGESRRFGITPETQAKWMNAHDRAYAAEIARVTGYSPTPGRWRGPFVESKAVPLMGFGRSFSFTSSPGEWAAPFPREALERLKQWTREQRRVEAARRTEPSKPGRERRTVKSVAASAGLGAFKAVRGVGHYGLALFLKELAVVAESGDRARIEEFYEGLLETDFYTHYGLFAGGAHLGQVAYSRYLERFVRPTFVSSVLRTNMALAAGMALPMLWEGQFDARTLVLSVSALGLSSSAVKASAASIKWVTGLERAREMGVLGHIARSRFARLGGWFYTVGELAVVLYLAEGLEGRFAAANADELREALGTAALALVDAANAADATVHSISRAADAQHQAWVAYRNSLYAPLEREEQRLAQRLQGAARLAKLRSDERRARLEFVAAHPAVREHVLKRHGSLKNYADRRAEEDGLRIEAKVRVAVESYSATRAHLLKGVYGRQNWREGALLGDVETLPWILSGLRSGTLGDPTGGQPGRWASWRRNLARNSGREALQSAFEEASESRLQTYDDEIELLTRLAGALRRAERADLEGDLLSRRDSVARLRATDEALVTGAGLAGLVGSLGRSSR